MWGGRPRPQPGPLAGLIGAIRGSRASQGTRPARPVRRLAFVVRDFLSSKTPGFLRQALAKRSWLMDSLNWAVSVYIWQRSTLPSVN